MLCIPGQSFGASSRQRCIRFLAFWLYWTKAIDCTSLVMELVQYIDLNTEHDAPHNPFTHTHTHTCCTSLSSRLASTDSLAVQTEALQVLSALCKFYFPSSLSRCWPLLKELYLSHLTAASLPLQQHVLKMLEELLRALSSVVAMENADAAVLRSICDFWAELLGGSLATYIQGSSEHSSVTSQACNVLSTVGAKVMDALKVTTLTTYTDYVNHHMVEISNL